MIFEAYLSYKYLFCKRKEKFISLIALLSIGGVAVSVMSLIVVIAVMSGFGESLKEKIIGMNPHVVISTYDLMEGFDSVVEQTRKLPGVSYVYPFVEGQAMMNFENRVYGIFIKGVPSDSIGSEIIRKYLREGSYQLKSGEIVIGRELAVRLGVKIGDALNIMSPAFGQVYGDFPPMMSFQIIGIFKSEMFEYDNSLVFLTIQDARKLYGLLTEQAHGIGVEIRNIEEAHNMKAMIADFLPDGYMVKSWMDINKNLFAALKTEKNVMFILLTLAVLVAATNIISTLVMIVLEKTREIGILKSIGMTDAGIMKIFILEGGFIGMTGSLVGFIGGILFVHWMDGIESFVSRLTGFEVFPREVYYFDSIPTVLNIPDISVILLCAFFVSIIAAFYPAWKASRLSPVEAIRYE
ncbi:MAG: lipoprotein-releasing ABC transporter permease subunit [Candidatus Aureabacteria bacterium]|nr:lipoprotein-releasing ABC transporter permease subunit [Candidatus Auribacterota bacterium]